MPAPGATATIGALSASNALAPRASAARGTDPHPDRNGGIRDRSTNASTSVSTAPVPASWTTSSVASSASASCTDCAIERGIGRVEQAVDLHDRDAVQVGRGVVALRGRRLRQCEPRGPAVRARATSGFVYRRMTSRLS